MGTTRPEVPVEEPPMNAQSAASPSAAGFRLHFRPLPPASRDYAVPCDAQGQVDLDALTDQARLDYFFARTVIGRQFAMPALELNA